MPVATQSERRAKTRAAILQAGDELVREGGYAGTTIRDVLARAGVAAGGFYHHFSSKEDLFLAVLEAASPRVHAIAERARASSATTLDQAIAEAQGVTDMGVRRQGDYAAVFTELAAAKLTPEQSARLRDLHRLWIAEVSEWIGVLQQRGLARADRSAHTLAAMVLATQLADALTNAVLGDESAAATIAAAELLRP